jgi:plastocyanin
MANPRPSHLAAAALLGAALAACGAGSSPTPAPAAPAAVAIRNFAFGPATLSVARGTTVTWTNRDSSVHTATAAGGAFDSRNLAQGRSFSHTFDTAGTFAYRCDIHQYMTGTITVTG